MQVTKPKSLDFFKGMAMGVVDIVPGVSGSTIAVLLNIYTRFITALNNIDAELFKGLWRLVRGGFAADKRHSFAKLLHAKDLPWLLTLLAGLATAFIIASFTIPILMQRYPVVMRGFFFGLVLGSIITPLLDLRPFRWQHFIVTLFFASAIYVLLGQQFTAPSELIAIHTGSGDTVESICETAPCLIPPAELLGLPQNAHLLTEGTAPSNFDEMLKASTTTLPENSQFFVLQAPYYYCVLAGFLAICAMLLPGISGSFILLVLGLYYFMLNTIKTFLTALSQGEFYAKHFLYVMCFMAGALLGIALFSRALNWLFKHYKNATLAAIIGLLLGCLRAIWPFRLSDENIFPNLSTAAFLPTSIALLAGLSLVAISILISRRKSPST